MKAPARALTYGSRAIHYDVLYLERRKSLTIEVHPDGQVQVRAPAECSEALIHERVRKRAGWIHRQLMDFERYRPRTPPRQYINGESHLYLGRQYRLRLSRSDDQEIKLTRGEFRIAVGDPKDRDQVRTLLRRWYRERAKALFNAVLDERLPRFSEVERPRLIIRTMRTRWGSLSPSGSMTLNVDLIRAPRACIEYVVAHELCHTQHRNHDARFFKLLGQVMPDWERRKDRLESALL